MGELTGEQREDALGLMMDYLAAHGEASEAGKRKSEITKQLRALMETTRSLTVEVNEYEAAMAVGERTSLDMNLAKDVLKPADLAKITRTSTIRRITVRRKAADD